MARKALAVVAVAFLVGLVSACGGSSANGGYQMMQFGPGMMGYGSTGEGAPVSDIAAARRQAQPFADSLGLRVGEVMQFTRNFYAELTDSSGKPMTEVLVNPRTGFVWFEYGPAMMWNTKLGVMGGDGGMMGGGMMGGAGMMGGGPFGDPSFGLTQGLTGKPTVSSASAEQIATEWLAAQGQNLHAGKAEPFPGYYTLHVLRGDRIVGMLSVSGYTGTVWYHWWHGRFIRMAE